MFFTTIFNIIIFAQISTLSGNPSPDNPKVFKSLKPIVYEIHDSTKNSVTYNKVPTKLIKINENSN